MPTAHKRSKDFTEQNLHLHDTSYDKQLAEATNVDGKVGWHGH